MLPVSVVVLTFNESKNMEPLLDNLLQYFDDIHVLDSASTDDTVQITQRRGVSTYEHKFEGFGKQRNWAIDNIPNRNKWVLHLDADERVTDEFVAELQSLANDENDVAGYFVPHKLMLGNTWLKRSGGYPVYQVRFFHSDRLRFENHGHGQREVPSGRLAYMKNPYLHYAFSHGLDPWLKKHVGYAIAEAHQTLADNSTFFQQMATCFASEPVKRRRAMKSLSMRLPFRSIFRIAHILLLKRGILDGKAGISYAMMLAAYESMYSAARWAIDSKIDQFGNNVVEK